MLFYVYVFFLIFSGVMLLGMGALKAPYARRSRTANFIFGTGFTVYGLYLVLFGRSGHYIIFFYAFILPILLAVRFFRERAAYQAGSAAPPAPSRRATETSLRAGTGTCLPLTGSRSRAGTGSRSPDTASRSPGTASRSRGTGSLPPAGDSPRPATGRRDSSPNGFALCLD